MRPIWGEGFGDASVINAIPFLEPEGEPGLVSVVVPSYNRGYDFHWPAI